MRRRARAARQAPSFPRPTCSNLGFAFMDHLLGMRPPAVKGNFVRKICVSTTMGPGALISYGE